MTRKQDAINYIMEEAWAWVKDIKSVPDDYYEEQVHFYASKKVYMLDVGSVSDMKEQLRPLVKACGPYKMGEYHAAGLPDRLAVSHKFDNGLETMSFIRGLESALAELSEGKCKIETKSYEHEEVVCELDP